MKTGGRIDAEWIGKSFAHAREFGLTVVELMIAIALGLLIVMAATALLLSSKSSYISQDDSARLQDSGRYAIESMTRAVRQAGHENWDKEDAPFIASAGASAGISGLDAHSLHERTDGIDAPLTKAIHGSDVLALRFFGVGSGVNGDGTIANCAGFGVPAPASTETSDQDRGWSIFYVAESAGEPELRCKYLGKSSWTSDAIARGVESFQVLYGLDTDADGLPNQFLTAMALKALDDTLVLNGTNAAEIAADKNRKTYWKKIVAVKVAVLLRGAQSSRTDALTMQYDLFGKDYSDANAAVDSGTRIREQDLPNGVRNRVRKIFSTTIQLRNQMVGDGT